MKTEQLLGLYPRAWQERYGGEMLALIDESGTHGWQLTSDLLRGCVGAWLMAPLGTWQPPKWLVVPVVLGGWAAGWRCWLF